MLRGSISATVLAILGGWELAPIITARSGNPFTLYDCSNAYTYCPRAFVSGPIGGSGITNVPTPGTPDNYEFYGFARNFSIGQWYNPVLNHANFYVSSADSDTSSYNYVDGYRDGHRDIQLGAKIIF
jgi:hypothetical protein